MFCLNPFESGHVSNFPISSIQCRPPRLNPFESGHVSNAAHKNFSTAESCLNPFIAGLINNMHRSTASPRTKRPSSQLQSNCRSRLLSQIVGSPIPPLTPSSQGMIPIFVLLSKKTRVEVLIPSSQGTAVNKPRLLSYLGGTC